MLSYSQRAQLCQNPAAKSLLNLMEEKQTNLCLAADVTAKAELLRLAGEIGPEICVFKTHIDIIEDFDADLVAQLKQLASRHRFLLFEDRKFADIGHTVKHQYQGGIYHIVDWAHLINAHTVPGPGIIKGLKEVGLSRGRGVLLLAEMSSEDNLATGEYTQKTVQMALANLDFVAGFITTRQLIDNPVFINFTPGVQMAAGGDALGQQYQTPEKVIKEQKSDIIIVGRGIYEAPAPLAAAQEYRRAGWQAYQNFLIS